MTQADDYLNQAKSADEYAARCVSGSDQQRQFREIAKQWRILAREAGNFAAGVFMISAFFAARRRTDALSSGYHIKRKWRRAKPDEWRIQCPGIITLAI